MNDLLCANVKQVVDMKSHAKWIDEQKKLKKWLVSTILFLVVSVFERCKVCEEKGAVYIHPWNVKKHLEKCTGTTRKGNHHNIFSFTFG